MDDTASVEMTDCPHPHVNAACTEEIENVITHAICEDLHVCVVQAHLSGFSSCLKLFCMPG